MEKAFWGMVAGCTLIFGILLGMYLNKSGAVDFSPKADQTQETTQTDQTADEIEQEGEITSLLQETQGNYAAAMKALEEEQTESPQQPEGAAGGDHNTSSTEHPLRQPPQLTTPNGSVAPDRNGNHNYFMDDPSATQPSSADSSSESQTEDTPESKKNDLYQYDLYKDHVVITKYLGKGTDVVIPDTLDGQPVTELAASAFASSKTLVRVEIPDTVSTMGDSVFKSDAALVEVVMPDSLDLIGTERF